MLKEVFILSLSRINISLLIPSRMLPNYFAWFLLKKFSPVLPDDYFAQYYFNAPATEMGSKGKEKWRACLLETETTMPFSVGMMFTKDVITQLKVNKVHLRYKFLSHPIIKKFVSVLEILLHSLIVMLVFSCFHVGAHHIKALKSSFLLCY